MGAKKRAPKIPLKLKGTKCSLLQIHGGNTQWFQMNQTRQK
jgi:hypothetical protein